MDDLDDFGNIKFVIDFLNDFNCIVYYENYLLFVFEFIW